MDPSIKVLKRSGPTDLSNASFLRRKKKDYKAIISLRFSKKKSEFYSKGDAYKIASPFFIGIIPFIIFKWIQSTLLKINVFSRLNDIFFQQLFTANVYGNVYSKKIFIYFGTGMLNQYYYLGIILIKTYSKCLILNKS